MTENQFSSFEANLFLKASLLIVLIPFIILSFFSHPIGDDFCESSLALELGYWKSQIYWYNNHDGRYFSFALRSLYPYISDLLGGYFNGYKFIPLFIFTTLFLAIFTLLKTIVKVAMPKNGLVSKKMIFWGTLAFYTIYITRIYSPREEFYWLSGALVHSFACILLLFFSSLLLLMRHFSRSQNTYMRIFYTILCSILIIGIVGSNEIYAVLIILTVFIGALVSIRSKHYNYRIWLILLIIATVATAISFFAPGNSVIRPLVELKNLNTDNNPLFAGAKGFELAKQFYLSLLKAGYIFIKFVCNWIVDPVLLSASLLIIPIGIKLVNKTRLSTFIKIKRINVILVFVLWLFFSFLPIFMPRFAGGYIPYRAINSSFLIFLVGWFVCILLLIAVSSKKNSQNVIPPKYILVSAQLVMILGLLFVGNFKPAVKDLLFSAPVAHSQLKNRYRIIAERIANEERNIVVPALTKIPRTMINEDPLYPDMSHIRAEYYNKCQARFFDVDSIISTQN